MSTQIIKQNLLLSKTREKYYIIATRNRKTNRNKEKKNKSNCSSITFQIDHRSNSKRSTPWSLQNRGSRLVTANVQPSSEMDPKMQALAVCCLLASFLLVPTNCLSSINQSSKVVPLEFSPVLDWPSISHSGS